MMNSLMPCAPKVFMMCQRIGRPPISTIGLGLSVVSSDSLDPSPPARITTFMDALSRNANAPSQVSSSGIDGGGVSHQLSCVRQEGLVRCDEATGGSPRCCCLHVPLVITEEI